MNRMVQKFKPVRELRKATFTCVPSFAQNIKPPKGIMGRGLKYENFVINYLEKSLPEEWVSWPHPWFEFLDGNETRYAQADWLGINAKTGLICIVEVKLSRVSKAWWQLNHLYRPLVKCIFDEPIACVEIVNNLKPVKVPEDVQIIHKINQATPELTSVLRLPFNRSYNGTI